MQVGFMDAQGPRRWRGLVYLLPSLMFFLGLQTLDGVPAAFVAVLSLVLWNVIGAVGLSRQRSTRNATLEVGPGYVDVKHSGIRNQRILAKEISGATTSRNRDGIIVTLQHKKRDQPILITVQNDAEAEKIRHALGIGHGGFGSISWRLHTDSIHRAGFIGRILAAGFGLLTLAVLLGAGMGGLGFIQFVIFAMALGFMGFAKAPQPSVVMGAEGLKLKTLRGWFALPYGNIQYVEDHQRGLVFTIPAPWNTVAVERSSVALGGLSDQERRALVAQINAAAARARGLGPQKDDATGRVDVLRRNGETRRDWLVRLDMAGQMLSSGHGYRGHTLDEQDLWVILEDPEADIDLRAAAARILRHAPKPETRVRINTALAAVREEADVKRLRIAVSDDIDGASQELTHLDAQEAAIMRQQRLVAGNDGR